MYKLAKWAFNRGVAHERNRIKRLIAEFSRDNYNDFDRMRIQDELSGKKRAEKDLHQIEIKTEANRIILRLIEPDFRNEQIMQAPAPIDEEEK